MLLAHLKSWMQATKLFAKQRKVCGTIAEGGIYFTDRQKPNYTLNALKLTGLGRTQRLMLKIKTPRSSMCGKSRQSTHCSAVLR